MIRRIWHGWTSAEAAPAYERLLVREVIPGIIGRDLPGLERIEVLRRRDADEPGCGFVTIMGFEDWAAVEAFAGGGQAVVPDAARRLLDRFDARSQHYDLVHRA